MNYRNKTTKEDSKEFAELSKEMSLDKGHQNGEVQGSSQGHCNHSDTPNALAFYDSSDEEIGDITSELNSVSTTDDDVRDQREAKRRRKMEILRRIMADINFENIAEKYNGMYTRECTSQCNW